MSIAVQRIKMEVSEVTSATKKEGISIFDTPSALFFLIKSLFISDYNTR